MNIQLPKLKLISSRAEMAAIGRLRMRVRWLTTRSVPTMPVIVQT